MLYNNYYNNICYKMMKYWWEVGDWDFFTKLPIKLIKAEPWFIKVIKSPKLKYQIHPHQCFALYGNHDLKTFLLNVSYGSSCQLSTFVPLSLNMPVKQ
jgi:hypothetical protein